ncbi:MAG: choice-of-anchor R domain-containing protein [Patescibacteria group bacterium]
MINIISRTHFPKGQAAIIGAILAFVVSSSVVASVGDTVIRRLHSIEDVPASLQSYYAAESGVEDALLRLIDVDYTVPDNYSVTVNGASAVVTIDQSGNSVTVRAAGDNNDRARTVEASLTANSAGASFSYGIQVGDGGLTMRDNSVVYGNVYSNGSVVGTNHATITGDVIVATGTPSTADAEYTFANADHSLSTASATRAAAQSFRPATSGLLTQVAVNIAKVGTPTDNLRLRIATDNSNKPSGTVLALVQVPAAVVGTTASWITLGIDDPPTLTAGTRYWLDLDTGTSSPNNYWKWRKDTSDAYPNETAKTASSCCSNGTSWSNMNADLDFRTWVGGSPTRIEGMIIGDATSGSGRANTFVESTIHGSPCPNAYCITDSPTPSQMPISEGLIQDWRDQAEAGGTCAPPVCDSNGNLEISGQGNTVTIGPLKIDGDLTITNYGELVLTGTVWVTGNIDFNNHCSVRLDEGYGVGSGVILASGWIDAANHCSFSGSGEAGSYPLVITTYADTDELAIDLNNNSSGVIFYASAGTIEISNGSAANSLVGYAISIKNNATITYDSGLLDMNFTNGPTGGWTINSWKEVE